MRRLMLLAFLLAACARPAQSSAPDPAPVPVSSGPVVVVPRGTPVPPGAGRVVIAEVSATPAAREVGLSGRDRLAEDEGMLFVYPDERPRRFWMKDCLIPLDIAFLRTDGVLVRLATLPPGRGLRGEEIPAADCPEGARYVLETNAGWFARHGVSVGDRVDVRAAVEGVVPE